MNNSTNKRLNTPPSTHMVECWSKRRKEMFMIFHSLRFCSCVFVDLNQDKDLKNQTIKR